MKGSSINTLWQEVERVEQAKQDFIISSQSLSMVEQEELPLLDIPSIGKFGLTEHAHLQMAERLQIPKKYYDRMRTEAPDLLCLNVNQWLKKPESEKRLVRTLDGRVRAILSDRYRPYDNYPVALGVMEGLKGIEDLEIQSANLTDTNLYIQVVSPRIQDMVKVNDIVQAGIMVSNSEIGLGAVRVEPLVWRLKCLNGMVLSETLRKAHIGRKLGEDGYVDTKYFQQETIAADMKAFMMTVRDMVKAAVSDVSLFQAGVEKLKVASGIPISGKLESVIENVTTRFSFSADEKDQMFKNLISDGDLTRWGLANAITAVGREVENADRAAFLERTGGNIIELSEKDWSVINN